MEIRLTTTQWRKLQDIVSMGKIAEGSLGLPAEVINGNQKIEIEANEVKITLDD